jgi:hypothetical protein
MSFDISSRFFFEIYIFVFCEKKRNFLKMTPINFVILPQSILKLFYFYGQNVNLETGAFRMRSQLDREKVKPLMVANMVPLCSYQYEREFNTTRIPGVDKDKIVKCSDSRHIAVHHQGRWFKVYCYYAGRLLTTAEIEDQLDYIVNNTVKPDV